MLATATTTRRRSALLEQPKAYSYIRFSTPEQQKGDSLRRQTELAEEYAARKGLTLDTELNMTDMGKSAFRAANVRQGALGAFLRACDDGLVPKGSYLLVEDLDRVSRATPLDAMAIFQQIINEGITLVILKGQGREREWSRESIRDNPYSLFEALLTLVRANEESVIKSNRLQASWSNKRAMARQKPLTSLVPGWLRLDPSTKQFEILQPNAEVVQRIYQMTLDGTGQHRIAEALNKEGIPCFGKAKFWQKSYISKVLESPAVMGTLVPRKIETTEDGRRLRKPLEPIAGYYPVIVSDDDYRAVQAMRKDRRAPTVKGESSLQNVLASLAVCPLCGSAMTRVNKGNAKKAGSPKLVCTKAKVGAGCSYHSVSIEQLEHTLVFHADRLVGEVPISGVDLTAQITSADEELGELREDAKSLLRELLDAPSPTIRAQLTETEEAIREAEGRLQDLLEQQEVSSPRILKARLQELREALKTTPLNLAKANAVMRVLMNKVTVNFLTGILEFSWRSGATTELEYSSRFSDTHS